MRGLEGLLFLASWSTSLEDQNISPNISFYEKDMGRKLLIRSPLFIDTLQVLCVLLFGCFFFYKGAAFVPGAWEEFGVGVCNGVNAAGTILRENLILQGFGSSDPAELVFLSLERGYLLLTCGCMGMHPRPTSGLTCELKEKFRVTADEEYIREQLSSSKLGLWDLNEREGI